ncbi:TRPL translocation defect protein 14 [Lepeophtheirus salmonis]|uniref:TRPL translocation defect protein 14 n=1 Tax=Lepeophtheirus salmonis TaxID=72036 RepID=A0A7R8HC65_LEPSM|nr:TRPL translocation defect protein 14 [Lepeophtheirus salmonis]CAF3000835.1 TRPL translocation defect protein 14 [Lepeophtheirus salmonis]
MVCSSSDLQRKRHSSLNIGHLKKTFLILLKSAMETSKKSQKIVWKLVLTGGPCGGKTTGQARLSTFFEDIGWKVFRVPETATVLLSGGIDFSELDEEGAMKFQENLLKTMIQIENSFFDLAKETKRNCLVICDRGTMDASAYINHQQWENILTSNSLDEVELRDNRYNQVVHLTSAAKGAEQFYSLDHPTRNEGIELARDRDTRAAEAWVGHPYVDLVDNSSNFDTKIKKLIAIVAFRMGINVSDRLESDAKKLKFLVNGPLPQNQYSLLFGIFKLLILTLKQMVVIPSAVLEKEELKENGAILIQDYLHLSNQQDRSHFPIIKTRRCFMYNDQYFQLDIYEDPVHERCRGLMFLETYTTKSVKEITENLPPFLDIDSEASGDPAFSMFNLSLHEEWTNNKEFCHRLSDDEEDGKFSTTEVKEAEKRLANTRSKQGSKYHSQKGQSRETNV